MLTNDILSALHDEQITFGDFAKQTQGDFTAMATSIARRWGRLPPAIQVADLRQEMLLAVHTSLPDYDADRGDLRAFIVFRACSAARKELQRHSRSKARDERVPTRSQMQDADQEASHLAHQLLDMLPVGKRQHAIIHSLARTGSLDTTTDELLADPRTRNMFTTNPTSARYSVYRTARKLAHRAQATA